MSELHGTSLIGQSTSATGGTRFHAVNPATGEALEPAFISAAPEDVDRAADLAAGAFDVFSKVSGRDKAAFLRRVAAEIEYSAEAVIARAHHETALPAARLQSELARTCFQLRLFADVAEEGSWVDARIDHGDPTRTPLPKPDIRSMLRPLGPVAVFGSSNFPLAFSVAGGDSASALAAGCPVIVKAHPAHPGASELIGRCVQKAIRDLALPEGVFSLLFDASYETGIRLVQHPAIKAVGFTGSRAGGHALMRAASSRQAPIPVYAEMGSVNPVFIFPNAMKERATAIAAGLHASVTLGVGQFCTNPGLVFVRDDAATHVFIAELQNLMHATPEGTMLTQSIAEAYRSGVEVVAGTRGVRSADVAETSGAAGRAVVFVTDAETYKAHDVLGQEIFGPATIVVVCKSPDEFITMASRLEGQLTATVYATDNEWNQSLIDVLENKAGRIVLNGFPTGVEVGHAMVHGGPYPATSDGMSTSVGTRAIRRLARPVCWQNANEGILPDALKESNPLRLWRLVDGEFKKG